jgi:anthranilate synthase component 2
MTLSVLFIDNFDSFVFNLVDEFARRGCNVDVWRNDISAKKALDIVDSMTGHKLVVLSPGPGNPDSAGNCMEIIKQAPADLPISGVCLGHQSIVQALGGEVDLAGEVVHGKQGRIEHNGAGYFKGLPVPMTAGRYHSLVGTRIPEELFITARLGNLVMGVHHIDRPLSGVQFHPESILTPYGSRLIDNVIQWAKGQLPRPTLDDAV